MQQSSASLSLHLGVLGLWKIVALNSLNPPCSAFFQQFLAWCHPSFVMISYLYITVGDDACIRCLYNIITSGTFILTSINIINNEVGCKDDTMPNTVDTRRHCEED